MYICIILPCSICIYKYAYIKVSVCIRTTIIIVQYIVHIIVLHLIYGTAFKTTVDKKKKKTTNIVSNITRLSVAYTNGISEGMFVLTTAESRESYRRQLFRRRGDLEASLHIILFIGTPFERLYCCT